MAVRMKDIPMTGRDTSDRRSIPQRGGIARSREAHRLNNFRSTSFIAGLSGVACGVESLGADGAGPAGAAASGAGAGMLRP